MAYDKTDLKALITISAAERDDILAAGGTRGQRWFQLMWPYGVTTSTGEPTLATMVQAYDLALISDAQLEAVMACGIRADFLNQITVAAAPV